MVDNCVIAEVHGRKEVVNMDVSLIDKVRNKVVSLGGMFSLGSVQWQKFTDGLLEDEMPNEEK